MGRCGSAELLAARELDEQGSETDTFFAGKNWGANCALRTRDYDNTRCDSDRPGKIVKPSACKSLRN
jgi:hypothetical protein